MSRRWLLLAAGGVCGTVEERNVFGNIDDALNRAREALGLPAVARPVPFTPTVKREGRSSA